MFTTKIILKLRVDIDCLFCVSKQEGDDQIFRTLGWSFWEISNIMHFKITDSCIAVCTAVIDENLIIFFLTWTKTANGFLQTHLDQKNFVDV